MLLQLFFGVDTAVDVAVAFVAFATVVVAIAAVVDAVVVIAIVAVVAVAVAVAVAVVGGAAVANEDRCYFVVAAIAVVLGTAMCCC